MADNGNPFDTPLASEVGEHQQQQAATVQASSNGNPFDEPLLSEKSDYTGQLTNDVGNTVIVPKEGESFDDTMKRAAAHGKTVTPEQINAEVKTAPEKTAEVLGAAAGVGAGGAAALAAPGEVMAALQHLHAAYGAPAMEAIEAAAKAHPIAAKLITKGLEAAGLMTLGKYMKLFGPTK